MGVGEYTPLLLRSANRPQGPGELVLNGDDVERSAHTNHGNVRTSSSDNLFQPALDSPHLQRSSHHTQSKTDRRGWTSRLKRAASHSMLEVRRCVIRLLSGQRPECHQNSSCSNCCRTVPKQRSCGPCIVGTHRGAGIWWNLQDKVGSLMALAVWMLLGYSILTVLLLARRHQWNTLSAAVYVTCAVLALASHAKTALTDPGSLPLQAVPLAGPHSVGTDETTLFTMCSICQSFKPHGTHHCRICNRCIARMDHHCPWMNNCVGAGNFKHFILFLAYAWTCCVMAICQFALNYFLCASEACEWTGLEVHLVRVMSGLALGALGFLTTMILNVQYGILTGVGTIGRLKKKALGTWDKAAEKPMALEDIFGCAGWHTWWLPIDPVFYERDRVYGYAMSDHAVWKEATYTQQAHDANRRSGRWEVGEEPTDLVP